MVCCGKKCCECLEHWFRNKRGKLGCPYCRSPIHRVLDKGLKKEIENLRSSFCNHGLRRKGTLSTKYDGQVCTFATPLQTRFICKICSNVLKDPHLAICCGEKFCYSCIESLDRKSNKSLSVCPNCRSLLRHVEEKEMKSEVNSLKVWCSNKGCPWRGELSSYVKHLEECSHRIVECEHCRAEYKFIAYEDHLTECKKILLDCPNNCGEVISRENMIAHREECKLELVRCKHASEGCKEMTRRKDLKEHYKDHVNYLLCPRCNTNINSHEREYHYSLCVPGNVSRRTGTNRTSHGAVSNSSPSEDDLNDIRYFLWRIEVDENFRRKFTYVMDSQPRWRHRRQNIERGPITDGQECFILIIFIAFICGCFAGKFYYYAN